jgi:hypothetical protein
MKYYFIEPKYSGKREIHIIPEENIWTPQICPQCGGNQVKTSVPIKVMIKGEPCDFYRNSGKLLISSMCLELFERLHLTGYSVLPADVKVKGDSESVEKLHYYELVIDGRCGFAKDSNGTYLPKCDLCGRRFPRKEKVIGFRFDETEYDGSSIFAFYNLTNFPIVSDAVKKEIVKAKLSNFKFTELSRMEML